MKVVNDKTYSEIKRKVEGVKKIQQERLDTHMSNSKVSDVTALKVWEAEYLIGMIENYRRQYEEE